MSVTDLLDLDATALAHALRAGDASPTEVLDATLDAAAGVGADVGAFTVLTADLARTQALAAEAALVAARRSGDLAGASGLWARRRARCSRAGRARGWSSCRP